MGIFGGTPKVDTSGQERALKMQEDAADRQEEADRNNANSDLARRRARQRAGGRGSLVTGLETGVQPEGRQNLG